MLRVVSMFVWMLGFRTVAAAAVPFAILSSSSYSHRRRRRRHHLEGLKSWALPRAWTLELSRGLEVFGSPEGLKSRALPRA